MAIGSNPSSGDSQSFGYTGNVQRFTIPADGIYKLEVWGAAGQSGGSWNGGAGGQGGYSKGFKKFTKGQVLYIVCGGLGWNAYAVYGADGGYNGGGAGRTAEPREGIVTAGGGGATHIATVSGELKALSAYKDTGEILIVAGGGGAGGGWKNTTPSAGGAGGGLTGSGGSGGSQTAAGSYGGFGYGGTCGYTVNGSGGGGGGWYGGGAGGSYTGGSGGSGYIGNVPSFSSGGVTYAPSTSNGGNGGHGRAVITYMAKNVLFNFNGTEITDLIYNGTAITSLVYNGTKIF